MPCTGGTPWNNMNGRTPEGLAKIEEHVKVFDRIFAAFTMCAKNLIAKGGHIINEWPTGCKYWRKPKVHKTFAKLKLSHAVLIHGCALGLKSVAVKDRYIKKPWKLRASFHHIADAFENATCPGVDEFHIHTPCAGVDTKLSEEYTLEFVQTAHLGILAHARTMLFNGSSSDACTDVIASIVVDDIAHDKLVGINSSSHVCTPHLAETAPAKVSLHDSVNNNNIKRVTALPAIIKTLNLKHIVCACVVNHTFSAMASHSHTDGTGRETEDDDMRDIWPHAIDDTAPPSSVAPAVAVPGGEISVTEPSIDIVPVAMEIEALRIDPTGSDALEAQRILSNTLRDALHRERCDKAREVLAERKARGAPLPVAATPPHRATVEEQQALRNRLAMEKATAFANRKSNLAIHGTPNIKEQSTDFLEPDSEEELQFGAAPSTNVPRGPLEPMGWPALPIIVVDAIEDGYRRILLQRLSGVSLHEPPYQLYSEPMSWSDWLRTVGHLFLKLNRPEHVAVFGQLALRGHALADSVENLLRHKSTAGCTHLNHAALRYLSDPRGDGNSSFTEVTPNQCIPDLNCTIIDYYSDSTVMLEKWEVNKYVSRTPIEELRAAFRGSQQVNLTATAGATAEVMTKCIEKDNKYREDKGTIAGRKTTSIKQRTVGVIITCLNDAFGARSKFVATTPELIDKIIQSYKVLLTTLVTSSRFVVLCITEDTRVWCCHQDTLIDTAKRIATVARRMGVLVTTTDRWYTTLERKDRKAWHFLDTPANREVIAQDLEDMTKLAVMLQSPGHLRDLPVAWRQILIRDYAIDGNVADPDIFDTAPILEDQLASTVGFLDSASCRAVDACVERLRREGRETEIETLLSQHEMTREELESCIELAQLPGRSRAYTGGSPNDLKQQAAAAANYCKHEHWRSKEYLDFEKAKLTLGLESSDMVLDGQNHGWVPKGLLLQALIEQWPSNRPAIENDSYDPVLFHMTRTSDKFALLIRRGQIIAVRCRSGHTSLGRIDHAANMTKLMPADEHGVVWPGYAVLPPILYHRTDWKRCRMILQGNIDTTHRIYKGGGDQNCYSPFKVKDPRYVAGICKDAPATMAIDSHEAFARGATFYLGESGAILTPDEIGGNLITEVTDSYTDLTLYLRPTEHSPSEEGGTPLSWWQPCPNKRCYHRISIGQTQCFGCATPISPDHIVETRSRSRSAAARRGDWHDNKNTSRQWQSQEWLSTPPRPAWNESAAARGSSATPQERGRSTERISDPRSSAGRETFRIILRENAKKLASLATQFGVALATPTARAQKTQQAFGYDSDPKFTRRLAFKADEKARKGAYCIGKDGRKTKQTWKNYQERWKGDPEFQLTQRYMQRDELWAERVMRSIALDGTARKLPANFPINQLEAFPKPPCPACMLDEFGQPPKEFCRVEFPDKAETPGEATHHAVPTRRSTGSTCSTATLVGYRGIAPSYAGSYDTAQGSSSSNAKAAPPRLDPAECENYYANYHNWRPTLPDSSASTSTGNRPSEPIGPPPGWTSDPYGPPPNRPPPRFEQQDAHSSTVSNPASAHTADIRFRDRTSRSSSTKRHRRNKSEPGCETESGTEEARSPSRHRDNRWQPKASANRWSNAAVWTAATWSSYANGSDGSDATAATSLSMFEFFLMVLGAIAIIAATHVSLWAWDNKLGIEAYTRVTTTNRSRTAPRPSRLLAEPAHNPPDVNPPRPPHVWPEVWQMMSKKQKGQARNAWVTFARRNDLPFVVFGPDIVGDSSAESSTNPAKQDSKPGFPDHYPLEDGMTPDESIAQCDASILPEEFTTAMSNPIYANRTEASVYITLPKRISQR